MKIFSESKNVCESMSASKCTEECVGKKLMHLRIYNCPEDKDILDHKTKVSKNQTWNLILWVAELQHELNSQLCRVSYVKVRTSIEKKYDLKFGTGIWEQISMNLGTLEPLNSYWSSFASRSSPSFYHSLRTSVIPHQKNLCLPVRWSPSIKQLIFFEDHASHYF